RPAGRVGGLLAAALLEQQMVAVGGAGVQYAVLPVRRGGHQLFPDRDARLGQPLPSLIDVADAELPGQDVIWGAEPEPGPALDAELDRSAAERGKVRVLGALVGHVEAQPDIEVALGRKVGDEQDRD